MKKNQNNINNYKSYEEEQLEKSRKKKKVFKIIISLSLIVLAILLLMQQCTVKEVTLPQERDKLIDDGSGDVQDGELQVNAERIRLNLQGKADASKFVPSHNANIYLENGRSKARLLLSNLEENQHIIEKGREFNGKTLEEDLTLKFKVVYELRETIKDYNDIQTFQNLNVVRVIEYKESGFGVNNKSSIHTEEIHNITSIQELYDLENVDNIDISKIKNLKRKDDIKEVKLVVRELVYKSKALNPGQYIEEDYLFKNYPKGTYNATFYAFVYNYDTNEHIGTGGGNITITVAN